MKAKKLFPVIMTALLLSVTALSGFAGCAQDDEELTYDVAIKIANNYGMEWVFEPGVDELYYEFEYTGEDMTFNVESYYVYGEPRFGDRWHDNSGMSGEWFYSSYWHEGLDGETDSSRIVKERGIYIINYSTRNSQWNYRDIVFNVKVK